MQTYTYHPSLNYSYNNGSSYVYVTLPTIVNACSAYVGTKGLNIEVPNKTAFIPIVSNTATCATKVKVNFSNTTCALERINPQIYFCATACSCAYTSGQYDPGTFITYINGFTACFRDPNHSCCPFALCCSHNICLYTCGIGWKCMGSIVCGCYKMTASTYSFANACVAQWRCIGVYMSTDSGDMPIGNICTYMPSKPSPGQTSYCTTNCSGSTNILNYIY